MENTIIILIAFWLGFGQGVKRKRKKDGKTGGVFADFKERMTSKGRIIREQDEEIYRLKEEIISMNNKKEKQENCYTKGSIDDLQKTLLVYLWNNKESYEAAIKCYMYMNILFDKIEAIKEERYTQYGWQESYGKICSDRNTTLIVSSEKIKNIEYVFDFNELAESADCFIKDFNNFKFNVSFQEFRNCLEIILKKSDAGA